MKYNYLLFLLGLILFSCIQSNKDKKYEEINLEGNLFTSKEIGWSIEIPEGWEIIKLKKIENKAKDGLKLIEEASAEEYDISGLKHLINFKKDRFNVFNSSIEVCDFENVEEWEENNKMINGLIYDAFTNKNMKIDTLSSHRMIGGLDFNVFHVTLYGPDNNIILNQEYFSRYIKGYSFGVNINYNNSTNKEVMIDAFKNSKFEELENKKLKYK